MHFISHGAGGPPSCMSLQEMPPPTPKAGEVLIKVAYAGVNRPDVIQRTGSYPAPPGASPIMGLEMSGMITQLGDGVSTWKVGDAVCALTPGGGYAEFCVAPAAHCLPLPKGLTLLQAAGLPENVFTVWVNVFEMARLKAGESFLVHGGSSGIGYTAIQLAKAFGATVYATVGSAEKAEFCRQMGADYVYNYKTDDWTKLIFEQTGKKGVNVILDMVGGDYIPRNIRLLALEGRLSQIAFLQGSKVPDFDALNIMMKRLTFTGSTLRARPDSQKAAIATAVKENVWPLVESGRFKVVVHKVFPLAEAPAAHELMESSQHVGKIMLQVAGG